MHYSLKDLNAIAMTYLH